MATVAELWRYPAKSMMGERLEEAAVGGNGVAGDRGWAVRDEVRGGIRGAKKIGSLMRLAARYVEEPTGALPPPPIAIRLPDGSTVRSDDPAVDATISAALGHAVTLWPLQPATDREHYRRGAPDSDDILAEARDIFGREPDEPLPDLSGMPADIFEFESPPGTYFDAYPIHLLTTASLRALARLAPGSRIDVRRFRPNILVDTPGGGDAGGGDDGADDGEFPEQGWIGRRITVGDVGLEVVTACPRCVMVTRGFADLPQDGGVLRTVVRHAGQNLGVYARVTEPGTVRLGDRVELDAG